MSYNFKNKKIVISAGASGIGWATAKECLEKGAKVFLCDVDKKYISKLKKHWASGIGSFDKQHILNHKSKRFQIEEEDIESLKIPSLQFHDLIKKYQINEIDKMIIDVEGSEYKSLVGLRNTMVQDSPIIAIEQLEEQFDKITKKTDSIEFLKQNNYKFFYEPIFYKRKRSKNKIINAINKLIFLLQMTFNLKKNNQYSLKKIENFEISGYSMILASKIDIMNIKVSASGS